VSAPGRSPAVTEEGDARRVVENDAAPLWVLLGNRHGDNRQLLAIADALGRPYRAVQLRFGRGARLAPARWFAHRLTWRTEPDLAPPWPRAVLAAGRKSVPAALWIRRASGGTTRLVHVNRPWAPLAWFDLVVTTPQYALPGRDNVLANLLPFVPPVAPAPLPESFAARAAALPRPWTAVLVGGNSRPFVLDAATATRLAATVNDEVRRAGGAAWLLDSPRTPAAAMAALERALAVPAQLVRWGRDENCYAALLGLADRFVVTADSASMLAEALLSGRPVTPFALPVDADWRWRLAAAWRHAADRAPRSIAARLLDRLVGLGVVSSVRDLGRLQQNLADAGLFGAAGRALAVAEAERARTVARIQAVIDRP
jgi:mitochondrial fission protein ELM1